MQIQTFGYYDDGDKRRKYHLSGTSRLHRKCALKNMTVSCAISKISVINCCYHCLAISKKHIENLCCHCKNLIQNAYCKFMLSLQEVYPKIAYCKVML